VTFVTDPKALEDPRVEAFELDGEPVRIGIAQAKK
jgi:hypothetical protein